jgi:hypothetical protein
MKRYAVVLEESAQSDVRELYEWDRQLVYIQKIEYENKDGAAPTPASWTR